MGIDPGTFCIVIKINFLSSRVGPFRGDFSQAPEKTHNGQREEICNWDNRLLGGNIGVVLQLSFLSYLLC